MCNLLYSLNGPLVHILLDLGLILGHLRIEEEPVDGHEDGEEEKKKKSIKKQSKVGCCAEKFSITSLGSEVPFLSLDGFDPLATLSIAILPV